MQNDDKILVVGQFSKKSDVYCYADSFVKSFEQLGQEVVLFKYYPPSRRSLLTRFRYFFWQLWMNVSFFITTWLENPEVLFVFKGEFLYAKTIQVLKSFCTVKVIWFYPDSPFVFWNGNGNSEVLKVLPHVDLYLSWSKQLIPLLKHAGAKEVRYFPFGYDPDIFVRDVLNEDLCHEVCEEDYMIDVLFIGTWSQEREDWLIDLSMALPDLDLHIWGTGWWQRQELGYPLVGCIYGEEKDARHIPYLFSRAKIILNFLRPQNFESHNMRTIEVPATGNFLLTERSKEQAEELFEENVSVVCFSTLDELVEKIEYYLQHDEKRKEIAEQGYKRAQQYRLDMLLKNILNHEIQNKRDYV